MVETPSCGSRKVPGYVVWFTGLTLDGSSSEEMMVYWPSSGDDRSRCLHKTHLCWGMAQSLDFSVLFSCFALRPQFENVKTLRENILAPACELSVIFTVAQGKKSHTDRVLRTMNRDTCAYYSAKYDKNDEFQCVHLVALHLQRLQNWFIKILVGPFVDHVYVFGDRCVCRRGLYPSSSALYDEYIQNHVVVKLHTVNHKYNL